MELDKYSEKDSDGERDGDQKERQRARKEDETTEMNTKCGEGNKIQTQTDRSRHAER